MRLEFKEGERVKAICSHAYRITEGRVYTVVKFSPEFYDDRSRSGFNWPAYVTVIGDDDQPIACHAHRFSKMEVN